MLIRIIYAVIGVTFLFSFTFAQIEVDEDIDENTTWTEPWYRIMTDISVINGARLTIDSGVLVDFVSEASITVTGGCELVAGVLNEDVTIFTSSQATPAAGDWKALIAYGINGEDPATITLANCEICYGGEEPVQQYLASGPIRAAYDLESSGPSAVTVTNCYIHDCLGAGVDMNHGAPNSITMDIIVADSRIYGCDGGIKLDYPTDQSYSKWNWIDSCGYGMLIHYNPESQANDMEVSNNVIRRSQDKGVILQECWGYFENNVIDSSGNTEGEHGIQIDYGGGSGTNEIRNNIITNSADYAIYSDPEITASNNCCAFFGADYACSENVNCVDSLLRDPKFVQAYGDMNYYHLLWNSPCLGQGSEQLTNSNPAHSRSDMGGYGGPDADPYFVCIDGGGISNTTLDQDASPYHVLADFTNPSDTAPLTLNAEGCVCEFLFAENTGLTVYTKLNLIGEDATNRVCMDWLEENEIWDGITMAVGSEGDFDHAEILHADNGVCILDAKVSIDTCKVGVCDNYGIAVSDADLLLVDTDITGNDIGIYLYKSAAFMTLNYIHDNDYEGIYCENNAGFRADITPESDLGYNDFTENGSCQIKLRTDSKALMHNGHNNVVDQQPPVASYLITTSNNSQEYQNDVEQNWWGTTEELESLFDPTESFDWDPWDEEYNNHPEWFDPNLAWQAFAAAAQLENTGHYTAAIAAYQGVVENFPESIYAFESLDRVFYVTDIIDGDFNTLVDYYQGIVDTTSFVGLARACNGLETRSLIKAGDFQAALDRCEATVANPPSLYDSVYAVIDIGYVYLAAEAAGEGLDAIMPIGIYPNMAPTSYEDYRRRCDEALAEIEIYENMTMKKGLSVVPAGFTLSKPYPNPFNASTRISYSLLDTRDVNIVVFDVLGRKVTTLVNDRQEAGNYNIIWSGHTSSGAQVSSGIYFVRMETETGAQSAKMLLLR